MTITFPAPTASDVDQAHDTVSRAGDDPKRAVDLVAAEALTAVREAR